MRVKMRVCVCKKVRKSINRKPLYQRRNLSFIALLAFLRSRHSKQSKQALFSQFLFSSGHALGGKKKKHSCCLLTHTFCDGYHLQLGIRIELHLCIVDNNNVSLFDLHVRMRAHVGDKKLFVAITTILTVTVNTAVDGP
jgi:hypothetical protein